MKHYLSKDIALTFVMGRKSLLPKLGEEKAQPSQPSDSPYRWGLDDKGYYTVQQGIRP